MSFLFFLFQNFVQSYRQAFFIESPFYKGRFYEESLPITLLLSVTSQITERETGFFRSLSMVLIYNRGRGFHLQMKCEEAPSLVDP